MTALGNDRWRASFVPKDIGPYLYTIKAWLEPLLDWQKAIVRRVYDCVDVNGRRVVRMGLITTPRKNGKSGLVAALALDKLPPERHTRLFEIIDCRLQVIDRELEAIPPAGLRFASGPPGTTGTRCVEQQMQPVAGQPREARRRMHVNVESQAVAVELDGGVDVVHDVTNADSHDSPPYLLRSLPLGSIAESGAPA